jgi:hypothetical protein
MSGKKANNLFASMLAFLVVGYALLFLVQLWFEPFGADMFFKISVSYGVLATLLVVIYLIRREFVDEEKMRDDNYLD